MIIAIDGPAAAGKGTLAARLAAHFGLAHLASGLLYRAVGRRLLDAGCAPSDKAAAVTAARALTGAELDGDALRGEAVANAASVVAAMAAVRAALVDFQHDFAAHPPGGAAGAVIDGRDIGTVVFPQAEVKFFVTASIEARAERRLMELRGRGEEGIYARVLQDLKDRDARDSRRHVAPLAAAEDAFWLDTTELDADQAFAAALSFIISRT